MHRIDSATARPDVNGPGKAGFSDNSDLNGQDATFVTPSWMNAVQEELCALVTNFGGTLTKTNNAQIAALLIQALGAKTDEEATGLIADGLASAIERIETLENSVLQTIKVGQIVEFGIHFATASEVATHMGYGTWQRFGEGRATVGFSSNANDPVWARTAWSNTDNPEYGEYEHQLTVAEMPNHDHGVGGEKALNYIAFEQSTYGPDYDNSDKDGNELEFFAEGADQPHNNVQPSVVVDRWIRLT